MTAKLPKAALAARCTSISGLCSKNKIGSSVSRSTSRTSASSSAYIVPRRLIGPLRRSAKRSSPSYGSGYWSHTSLCDLGKGQARTALEVDILGEDECAESSEGFAGEEVRLASLCGSVSSGTEVVVGKRDRTGGTDIFEVLQQVGDCVSFAIGKNRLVEAIAGTACVGHPRISYIGWMTRVGTETYLRSMMNCRHPSQGGEARGLCMWLVRAVVMALVVDEVEGGGFVMVGIGGSSPAKGSRNVRATRQIEVGRTGRCYCRGKRSCSIWAGQSRLAKRSQKWGCSQALYR